MQVVETWDSEEEDDLMIGKACENYFVTC